MYSHDDCDRSVPSIVSSFSNVPLLDERVPKCNSSMHVNCLNVCEDLCIVVLSFDLYVSRSDSFVQPAGYHSCQIIKSDGSASFRRSDTGAILIGDQSPSGFSRNERVAG